MDIAILKLVDSYVLVERRIAVDFSYMSRQVWKAKSCIFSSSCHLCFVNFPSFCNIH